MATIELIDSVILSSQSTYITFDNIPSTYKDLVIWGNVRSTAAGGFPFLTCRINDHSSTGRYASTIYYSYWSGGSHGNYHNLGSTSDTWMKLGRFASGSTVPTWGTVGGVDVKAGLYLTFYNYSNLSMFTSVMSQTAGLQKAATTLFQIMQARGTSQYMHTEAIEKIEFGMHYDSYSFTEDSNLYLYGINNS